MGFNPHPVIAHGVTGMMLPQPGDNLCFNPHPVIAHGVTRVDRLYAKCLRVSIRTP